MCEILDPSSFGTVFHRPANVGATEGTKSSPGFVAEPGAANDRVRQALQAHFRPEFLNRFQHVTYFHPLTEEHVRQIARIELARVLERHGIAGRRIAVDLTPSVLDLIVQHGYDERYGARALRRIVQRYVTVPIATLLLERIVDDHSILRLVATGDEVTITVIETSESRAQKAELRPLKTRFGRLASTKDIKTLIEELKRSRLELIGALGARENEGRKENTSIALDGTRVWHSPAALTHAVRRRELDLSAKRRLARLLQNELELEQWLERAATREERQRLVSAISRSEIELRAVRRELLEMPPGSYSDAIIELVSLGSTNARAIELFRIYSSWAKEHGHSVEMVREPLSPMEPIIAAIEGHYVYGYLHLESGLHRFRGPRENNVVRVRVLPWIDGSEHMPLIDRTALKKTGLLGGRVRSRLQVKGSELVIQNERTLAENAAFAASIASSYLRSPETAETEVRRYDDEPFLLKDHLTGTTGRKNSVSPNRFHDLLCERISGTYADTDQAGQIDR